jgi:hypothetical protein
MRVEEEPRPELPGAGEEEREPGGVRVEAKRDAVEGLERRSRVGRETVEDESGSGTAPAPAVGRDGLGRGWRCLGSLMVEAAKGKDDIGSGVETWSGDCMNE